MPWILSLLALLVACAAPQPVASDHADTPALMQRIVAQLDSKRAELISVRRDIHRNPEPSGEEIRTSAIVASRLEDLGFDVRHDVGGHGVVGVLRGALPGRTIAFRADMDAVRDPSPDPVEFRSIRPGVRHICGHDVHTTIGLALAEAFAAIRDDLPGTVVLYFQPAEETGAGAAAMIAAHAMENPRPDAVFGFHTAPFEVGTFVTSETLLMTIRDRADFTVTGASASSITQGLLDRVGALNSATAFDSQPIDGDWVNVERGRLHPTDGGEETTVVFNLATARARANVRQAVDAAVNEARRANPTARIDVRYQAGWLPGAPNNTALAHSAVASIRSELGEQAIRYSHTVVPTFSEDFGHMQAVTPGVFIFLGVSNSARGWVGMPHTPNYVADEDAIFVGARAMARVMLDAMRAT